MQKSDSPAADANNGTSQTVNLPLTVLGLSGYFFVGTAGVLIPSIMPSISDEYEAVGLTLLTIGLIFPARAVGGISATFWPASAPTA